MMHSHSSGERADDTRLFWQRHVRAAGTELYLRLAQRLLSGVENYGVGFREHQVGAEHANKPNSAQVGVDNTSQGPWRYGADTQLLLTVDHDCDGLTLPSKWDPRPFSATSCTSEHLVSLLGQCKGDGHKGYFTTELLHQYGLSNATDDVGGMMDTYKRSGITALVVAVDQALAAKAGIHWSTTSHTSVDIDLYDAAGGGGGKGNRVLGRARMVLRSFVEQSE
ncbi:hypothetical protein MY3296_002342 [Beauveria thailandica]